MSHPRESTIQLIDMAEKEMLTWEQIARAALDHMSEAEVHDMGVNNDLLIAPDYFEDIVVSDDEEE